MTNSIPVFRIGQTLADRLNARLRESSRRLFNVADDVRRRPASLLVTDSFTGPLFGILLSYYAHRALSSFSLLLIIV